MDEFVLDDFVPSDREVRARQHVLSELLGIIRNTYSGMCNKWLHLPAYTAKCIGLVFRVSLGGVMVRVSDS